MAQRKSTNKVTEYTIDHQRIFIACMLSDRDKFIQTKPVIDAKYFDINIRKAVKYILEYTDEYNDLPSTAQIKAETKVVVDLTPVKETPSILDWYTNEIEEFCRHKAIEQIVLDGPKYLTEGRYGDLEAHLKEAIMISLNRDLGTNYFADPKARIEDMINNNARTSTGWADLDKKLYGGFAPGELNIFAAGSGGGKSLYLQNLAVNYLKQDKLVVYITLELSENLVSTRIDSMLTGIENRRVTKEIDNVALALRSIKLKTKNAELFIKKMPEGGTTSNNIKAYLKELQIQTGRKPDVLLVDYLDLMAPNRKGIDMSNLNIKDKYVSEELRALADEHQLIFATASQLNRGASEDGSGDYSHHHIAGGLSKIQTADNVMSLYRSSIMIEQGKFKVGFLKTRSSAGVGSNIMMNFDNNTLRITDDPDSNNTSGAANVQTPSSSANVLDNVIGAKKAMQSNAMATSTRPANGPSTDITALLNKVRKSS